jgi:DNA-binding GntR family transcriptional regulator
MDIRKSRTLSEDVLNTLRERIISGEFASGAPLRQNPLAKELGVSPIPVREALVQLESEGLVVSKPHHGSVVASLSLDDIVEVFEIRAYLEVPLLRRAIHNITERALEEAKEVLEEFDDALLQQKVQEYGRLNWQFHSLLYRPANRPQTITLAQAYHVRADRYTRVQLRNIGGGVRSQKEHRQLLILCRERDEEGAAKMLERHILAAGRELVDFLADMDKDKRP